MYCASDPTAANAHPSPSAPHAQPEFAEPHQPQPHTIPPARAELIRGYRDEPDAVFDITVTSGAEADHLTRQQMKAITDILT
jgi:hypothetical protein